MILKRTASNPQTRSTGISRFLSLPSNAMKGLRVNGVKGRRCRSNGSICGVPIAKCLSFIVIIGISLTFTVVSRAQKYNEAPMLAKLVKQGKLSTGRRTASGKPAGSESTQYGGMNLPFITIIGILLTFTAVSRAQKYNEAPMLAKLVSSVVKNPGETSTG